MAPEHKDIIWENLQIKKSEKKIAMFGTRPGLIFIFFFLCCSQHPASLALNSSQRAPTHARPPLRPCCHPGINVVLMFLLFFFTTPITIMSGLMAVASPAAQMDAECMGDMCANATHPAVKSDDARQFLYSVATFGDQWPWAMRRMVREYVAAPPPPPSCAPPPACARERRAPARPLRDTRAGAEREEGLSAA